MILRNIQTNGPVWAGDLIGFSMLSEWLPMVTETRKAPLAFGPAGL
jgi:hypothetical protein